MFFTKKFATEFDKQAEAMGRFNLGVFGKTGVGKSTLVNAVFGRDVAETGVGAPITADSHVYIDPRDTLAVIDTRGLEIGRDSKSILRDLRSFIEKGRRDAIKAARTDDQRAAASKTNPIHAVWYCVRGLDRRFEEMEAEFVRALDAMDVPVLLVVTQVPVKDGVVHPDVMALVEHIRELRLPIVGGEPFLVNAQRDSFADQPEHGLMALTDATFRISPKALQTAYAAAQRVSFEQKATVSQNYINAAGAAAAATAAVPIPLSDAAVLVPIQLGMMARIAHIYGVPLDRASLVGLASTGVATKAGQTAAGSLLKLIPGAGSIVGGLVNATVATGITVAMGQAWLAVIQRAAAGEFDLVSDEATMNMAAAGGSHGVHAAHGAHASSIRAVHASKARRAAGTVSEGLEILGGRIDMDEVANIFKQELKSRLPKFLR